MKTRKHYLNSPITEAVISIQAQLSPKVKLDVLLEMYSNIQGEYPQCENVFFLQGQMIVSNTVESTLNQQQIGYRALSSDRKHIIEMRLDGFSFIRLAPYECWENFRDEAQRIWRIYESLTYPEIITRLGIRYINRLDIPLPIGDLQEYLRTFPQVSGDLPQGLSGYFMQLQIPQNHPQSILLLNQAIVTPPTKEVVSILLDLDLFLEANIVNNKLGVWEILEQMHTQNNQAFEACITELTRELIN